MMEIAMMAGLAIGVVLGGVIGYLVATLKKKEAGQSVENINAELRAEQDRNEILSEDFKDLNQQLREEREKYLSLSNKHSGLIAQYKGLQERLKEQKSELEHIQEKFSAEFKNLANEILEEKSKKFTDQNKINLDTILKPLGEKITNFEKRVEQNNKESISWNSSLKTELTHLKDLNKNLTKEAESLTKALRGESKTQGNWGEMQLENILNKVGLQKDVHYFKEKNMKTEDGSNQRLDYIIKMPDDKYLILDSKVSLTAYCNYYDEDNKEGQARHLKDHLSSVNSHIKLLGEKNYHNLHGIQQPDFVLMFIANEPALTIALREDPSLYEKALDKNIVLVSTSTLLATLRTVSYIWKQDLQNKNAIEIARQGGALYDKFVSFADDLIKLGGNLKATSNVYNDAMNKLSEGSGNLIKRTEKLKHLGAKASKQMDQRLLDRSDDGETKQASGGSNNLFGS